MELIPITDFDQRYFPEITEDEKVQFIISTNAFERVNFKEEFVRGSILMPQRADPHISGQMRSIALLEQLAKEQNLIPRPDQISVTSFDNLFPWFTRFHKNLLHDLAQKGRELLNNQDYPLLEDLGTYRTEEKFLAHRKMPAPFEIKSLLTKAFTNYASVYDSYKDSLNNPRLLDIEDWQKLEQAAYKLCLRICCIKPFSDGSNRVARLTENLLRLNTGLRFRIHQDKDQFLRDVWNLQDEEYKISG